MIQNTAVKHARFLHGKHVLLGCEPLEHADIKLLPKFRVTSQIITKTRLFKYTEIFTTKK